MPGGFFAALREIAKVPIALIFAIAVQTGAGLIWAGAAGGRIRQLEEQAMLNADK